MNSYDIKGVVLNKSQGRQEVYPAMAREMGATEVGLVRNKPSETVEHKIVSTVALQFPPTSGGYDLNTIYLSVPNELFDQLKVGQEVTLTLTTK